MKNKLNDLKTLQKAQKVLRSLYDKNLIDPNDVIIIASGFENAIIGVSDTIPKKVIYDYWVALDILINISGLQFDDAEDWLNAFSTNNNSKDNDENVMFVKTLNPNLNY